MRKSFVRRITSTLLAAGCALFVQGRSRDVSAQTYSQPILVAVGTSPSSVFTMSTSGARVRKVFEAQNITALVSSPMVQFSQLISEGSIYSNTDGVPELLNSEAFGSMGLGINVTTLEMFYLGGSEIGLYKMRPYMSGDLAKLPELVTPLTPFHTPGFISVDIVTPSVYWTEYGVIDGTSTIKRIRYQEVNAAPTTFYSQVDADEGGSWIGPIAALRTQGLYYCLPGDQSSTIKYISASGDTPSKTIGTVSGRCTSMIFQDYNNNLLVGAQLPNGTGRISVFNPLGSLLRDIAVDLPVVALASGTFMEFSSSQPASTPIIKVKNSNVAFTFTSYQGSVSGSSLQASTVKTKYSYELVLQGPGKKKNKTATTTKTTYTYKKLKPGAYTFKYRVLETKGRKVSKSKYSAVVTFTIS